MNNFDIFLTVTSWEERYELGIKHFLSKNSTQKVISFNYIDYITNTEKYLENVSKFLDDKKINTELIILKHNDNKNNWNIVKDTIENMSGSLVIDMTTMPRDIIFYSLYHAEKSNKIHHLYCLYNRPDRYSNEKWLTRDPCKPLLLFNMSGIFEMGKETILIVTTGFDRKRVEQLLNYYEAKKVYIGLQTGEQYGNNILNKKFEEHFRSFLKIECFDIDVYTQGDYGLKNIENIIEKNMDSNIIIASLGPKPSSIALFRIIKKYSNIGLVYVPVTTYNMNYSYGIKQDMTIFEKIK